MVERAHVKSQNDAPVLGGIPVTLEQALRCGKKILDQVNELHADLVVGTFQKR